MAEVKKIRTLQLKQALFAPYGRILEPGESEDPAVSERGRFDFYVSFSETSNGWRIGYLVNLTKRIKSMERHSNTPEVFSPLSGTAVLVTSENPDDPESTVGFTLSKPIVFNCGVWHAVVSISDKANILIVENADVSTESYELPYIMTAT